MRDLQGSTFAKAKLGEAELWHCKLQKCDFTVCDLTSAKLQFSQCEGTGFQMANLTGADLTNTKLVGADFTGATLKGATLDGAEYDESTKLPKGFKPPDTMIWKGKIKIGKAKAEGSVDFETFHKGIQNMVDPAKLKKAASMLKSDKFQLFADVKPDSVVGIVKSQTDRDLVYSCRLASDGAFSCCTQNLRHCGGLNGKLCKHLLVLIVGLTQAEQLDPATVDHWIDTSRSQKPSLDTDLMSETFLRYKGAEAGEVDWRPTETLPEDFYAM